MKMKDVLYRKLLYRRKFYIRIFILVAVVLFGFFCSALLFGNLDVPLVSQLTELHTCPACYGISACPQLYSNKILFERRQIWESLFNVKNIFYGFTKLNRKLVLKKLAHDWELRDFDSKLCQTWKLKADCNPQDLIDVPNVFDKIVETVRHISTLEAKPQKGLIMCPYPQSILELIDSIAQVRSGNQRHNISKFDQLNIWTVLSINPEPLVLQMLKKSDGWPVPTYVGVCGRLEIAVHEGEPLYSLIGQPYNTKLKYAKHIFKAALDFTSKHEKYRFYLMDWSIDNIVAGENDKICFVDLEDVIILDKHISADKDLPEWHNRDVRDDLGPGFSFSIQDVCEHHLSDHNLWAACYVLGGDDRPFLYPIPKDINSSRPQLYKLLNECLYGHNVNRFHIINKLQLVIDDILSHQRIS